MTADAFQQPPKDENDLHAKPMQLDMGPSHPAMQGAARLLLTLDGETVLKAQSEIGYVHRGFEKEAEHATWTQIFPYTDRLNYLSPLLNNFGFALAVEKLLEIETTPRCNFIRTIMGEISRLSDHFTSIATITLDLGGLSTFLYAIEGRELVWDLIEEVTGARLTASYARVGGLKDDLTADFADHWKQRRERLLEIHDDIATMLGRNRIFLDRMQGIGIISADEALSHGFSGPCLRSTGIDYDIRKDHPYFAYKEVDFSVPVGSTGDNYDRYLVRMEEMLQSIRIIDQCLAKLPDGPINCDDRRAVLPSKEHVQGSIEGMITHMKLIFEGVQVPAGEIYSYTEGGNGELGYYIVSNGTGKPWRVSVRAPSFYHMSAIHKMLKGAKLSDIIPTFSTINMVGGELDR